jgi:hypothetical protein
MPEETLDERYERVMREEHEQLARAEAARSRFLETLLGADRMAWQAPPAIQDFDSLLCQHAAQLNNAIRYAMGDALRDGSSTENRSKAMLAITRMIQTNIAIAKVLDPEPPANSKTVHGGDGVRRPQD